MKNRNHEVPKCTNVYIVIIFNIFINMEIESYK